MNPTAAAASAFASFTAICACVIPAGCAGPTRGTSEVGAAAAPAPAAPARGTPGGLVAMVDGQSIEFGELRAAMVEMSGRTALLDRVVDLRLAARLRQAAITVDDAAIERERSLLLETLDADAARAAELLRGIRQRQGLGDARFAELLRRNAGLRALVAPSVQVDDEGIENVFDTMHGARRVARIAVLANLGDAEKFTRELAARPFIDLAVERSLDGSAARGGLLAPISRRDPSYPEPLRAAIFATAVGGTSAPILSGARYSVVQVVSETPPDGASREAERARCERTLRLARERLLMDALARELAGGEGVTIFDRGFDR